MSGNIILKDATISDVDFYDLAGNKIDFKSLEDPDKKVNVGVPEIESVTIERYLDSEYEKRFGSAVNALEGGTLYYSKHLYLLYSCKLSIIIEISKHFI